ncbi:hypothetical protein [Streptomyces sp. NRRL S-1022]|nr:hypothetical protein [Streptomyces sp. NRRL S-1022]
MQRTQPQPQPPTPRTEPLPPAAQQALARLERKLTPRPAGR